MTMILYAYNMYRHMNSFKRQMKLVDGIVIATKVRLYGKVVTCQGLPGRRHHNYQLDRRLSILEHASAV